MCENGLEACIAGDILDEVAKYLDDGDLISSLAPASRTLATAVDHCAARRCRALWSTSAEIEARGVRLGSAFLGGGNLLTTARCPRAAEHATNHAPPARFTGVCR